VAVETKTERAERERIVSSEFQPAAVAARPQRLQSSSLAGSCGLPSAAQPSAVRAAQMYFLFLSSHLLSVLNSPSHELDGVASNRLRTESSDQAAQRNGNLQRPMSIEIKGGRSTRSTLTKRSHPRALAAICTVVVPLRSRGGRLRTVRRNTNARHTAN